MRLFCLSPVKNQKSAEQSHYGHYTFAAIMILRGCTTASATILFYPSLLSPCCPGRRFLCQRSYHWNRLRPCLYFLMVLILTASRSPQPRWFTTSERTCSELNHP